METPGDLLSSGSQRRWPGYVAEDGDRSRASWMALPGARHMAAPGGGHCFSLWESGGLQLPCHSSADVVTAPEVLPGPVWCRCVMSHLTSAVRPASSCPCCMAPFQEPHFHCSEQAQPGHGHKDRASVTLPAFLRHSQATVKESMAEQADPG